MPSFATRLFGHHGVPSLFATHGDDTVAIVYRIGETECTVRGIKRAEAVEMRMDDQGNVVKERVCQLVMSADPTHSWGGIADVQLTGTFEIRPMGAPSGDRWAIDTEPGKGIQAMSESLVTVHLVRMSAVARAASGSYRS